MERFSAAPAFPGIGPAPVKPYREIPASSAIATARLNKSAGQSNIGTSGQICFGGSPRAQYSYPSLVPIGVIFRAVLIPVRMRSSSIESR